MAELITSARPACIKYKMATSPSAITVRTSMRPAVGGPLLAPHQPSTTKRKVSPACTCGDCKVDCSIIGMRQGPRKASVLIFSKPSIFLEPCLGCPLPPRRSSHSGDSLQCLLGHWVDACLPTEGSLPVLYSTLGSMPIHEILHLWLQLIRCVCLGWKIIVCHPSSFACIIYDSN